MLFYVSGKAVTPLVSSGTVPSEQQPAAEVTPAKLKKKKKKREREPSDESEKVNLLLSLCL